MFAKVTRPIGSGRDQRRRRARLARPGRIAARRRRRRSSPRAPRSRGTSGRLAVDLRAADHEGRRARSTGRWRPSTSTTGCAGSTRGRTRTRYLNGARLIVLRSHVAPEPTSADPGTIVECHSGAIHVATGHGGRLAIDEVQPEGRTGDEGPRLSSRATRSNRELASARHDRACAHGGVPCAGRDPSHHRDLPTALVDEPTRISPTSATARSPPRSFRERFGGSEASTT